jgi:hypothetical protein
MRNDDTDSCKRSEGVRSKACMEFPSTILHPRGESQPVYCMTLAGGFNEAKGLTVMARTGGKMD